MILRAVYIADGSSDLPLADHINELCDRHDLEIRLTTPDPARLGATSRAVADRVAALLRVGDPIDVLFVHRDAEAQPTEHRRAEVFGGASTAGFVGHVVPIVPARMTEAWLLLDEAAIREVAGHPRGTSPLGLPTWRQAESVPDPKQLLQSALVEASDTTGRRRAQFIRDFPRHRSALLNRLDTRGPVCQLPSWKRLVSDIELLAATVRSGS